MEKYNLYLDDFRSPLDSFSYTYDRIYVDLEWVIVRDFNQFCSIIEKNFKNGLYPDIISFDHDLSDEHYDEDIKPEDYKEKTGMECAKWFVEFMQNNNLETPVIKCHSMNPSGKVNILGLFESWNKFKEKYKNN